MTAALFSLAEPFGPVGLAEAQARARLDVRTDRKYVVDAERCERLIALLSSDHLALEIAGGRVCTYESVYFDTPDLLTYRQHLQRRRRRFKCRTRLYGTGACFFEVKLRGGRDETDKRRLELPRAAHGVFVASARQFLAAELGGTYGHCEPPVLVPSLATAFARLTLVATDASERVTCDFDLTFRAGGRAVAIANGDVVVETKTAHGNGRADRQLRRLGVRPVAPCSKYCLGIALTRGGVRDNPFRPLLRRHFDAVHPPAPAAAR